MKQIRFLLLALCLTAVSAYAARQATGQRLYSRLNLNKQQPRLLLPTTTAIEMSALNMERDPASGLTRLNGAAEIKITYGAGPATIVRADEITYDLNTGDIEPRGAVTICMSGTLGPTGPCL